jgi:hypothetical protein
MGMGGSNTFRTREILENVILNYFQMFIERISSSGFDINY